MIEEASSPVRRINSSVLGIFAFVGFIASITTIASFIQAPSSELSVKVFPSKARLPHFFDAAIGPGYEENGRTFFNTVWAATCQKEGSDNKSHVCKHVEKLRFASDQLGQFASANGVLYEMKITNDGSQKAVGLRMSGQQISFLDAYLGNDVNRVAVDYDSKLSVYNLPDINPGEVLIVDVWSRLSLYDNDEVNSYAVPKLSYNGQQVKTTAYGMVPSPVYIVYSMLNSVGPIFGWLLVAAFCFVVGIIILFFIGIITTIAQGRPISSMFQTSDKAKNIALESSAG